MDYLDPSISNPHLLFPLSIDQLRLKELSISTFYSRVATRWFLSVAVLCLNLSLSVRIWAVSAHLRHHYVVSVATAVTAVMAVAIVGLQSCTRRCSRESPIFNKCFYICFLFYLLSVTLKIYFIFNSLWNLLDGNPE